MKTDSMTPSQEVMALRYHTAVGPNADEVLVAKCLKLEKYCDEIRSLLIESDKQLASARREAMDMAISIKNSARDDNIFILKSKHA